MATELLSLDRVNAFYGDSHVLHDVSLRVAPGRLLALLGRNGAGKSTCMHAIVGFLAPRSGTIRVRDREVQGCAPEAICRQGIGFVPQGRRIFPTLSVRENLDVAARRGDGPGRRWTRDDVNAIFPRLKERERQLAGSLSGGEQQMVALGRALMSKPRLLLLDEPSLGIAPIIVREIARFITSINRDNGVSVILVEQNSRMALKLSSHSYVLETGKIALSGPSHELAENDDVRRAYLGG